MNILIIGSGHGIGLALVQKYLQDPKNKVVGTYRLEEKAHELLSINNDQLQVRKVDPLEEDQLVLLSSEIFPGEDVDILINCVGTLTGEGYAPEKSLRSITLEAMEKVFRVNSFITPLLAKNFIKRFSKESQSVFCSLSAKVGSIEDNSLGGWYSYRASKTALNMFLKTSSIEYERRGLKTRFLALHPGTTHTDLSKDYLQSVKHKVWQPIETASHIENIISSTISNDDFINCEFRNWDNSILEW